MRPTRYLPLVLLVLTAAVAAAPPVEGLQAEYASADGARLALAAVDPAALRAEDQVREARPGQPRRYGVLQWVPAPTQGAVSDGVWDLLPDGRWRWRLAVEAPGAASLEFGFSRFRLPAGAQLWIRTPKGGPALGPLTDADNPADGRYRSALLPGAAATLELTVPADKRAHLALLLEHVAYGYRAPFEREQPKSGSCNIDTVCPQGDDYREQIAATVAYTFVSSGSTYVCTGTLVSTGDAAQDRSQPRVVTAHHCVDTAAEAQSMVFYWGYESPTCRTPGSAASGTPLARQGNTRASQSGATLLATHQATDFTVVQLSQPVPPAANAYYSGWDRGAAAPPATVTIHHPDGDEKRISFDADAPTTMASCIISGTPGDTHWRIGQYEAGTTEPGSSGAGLWADRRDEGAGDAEDERLIGVLSGGDASCSVPGGYDCFGRLSQAWEAGSSAGARMRDWLDRTGANPGTVAGSGSCVPPALTLDSPAFGSAPLAGSTVTFTANVAGGPGPTRSFRWDVDGDGSFDREGTASTLQVRYPQAGPVQVRVELSDSAGCGASASRALDVLGAQLAASAGTPQQVCGDGDAALEPGERWKLPVTLRNTGSATLPAGGRALFARQVAQGSGPLATADLNGNGFGPYDDARTVDPIALGGGGLRLYGQTYTQAFMSTNGYVSFDPAESGGDWSNGCNGGLDHGAAGPQLRPLHDDLVVANTEEGAGLRYAWFPTCPRAPQSAPATQGCHVFEWRRLRWVDSDDVAVAPSGDASFQAIVYQPSGQIVYQYLAADPHAGARATLGVIGANGSDPLDVACNSAAGPAPTGRAICLFDPAATPSGGFPAGSFGPNAFGYRGFSNAGGGACPFTPVELTAATGTAVRLETPTLALPVLASGQETTLEVGFALPTELGCGSPVGLEYVGSAAPGVSSFARTTLLARSAGDGAACQTSSSCPAQIPVIDTRPGFYYNGQRSGNGLANFVYGTVYGGVWYTALADRSPTWYILNGDYREHLGVLPIRRFTNPAAPDGFAPTSSFVGTAWVAQLDRDSLLHAWEFAGGARGIELLDATPLPFTSPNHSQTWYTPAESGWGLSVESLVNGPNVLEFMVGYIYDAAGTARWVLGTDDSTSSGDAPLATYQAHCPSCPWLVDWAGTERPAGSLSRTYTGPAAMLFDSQISLPAPLSGRWDRSNLPLTTIGPPAPPGR